MATTVFLQLSGGKALMKVLTFSGLSHAMLVHPLVHGEPVLTAQAFYYLEELESIAKLRFENSNDILSNSEIEYLVDNYLFEFSKIDETAKISFKVSEGRFWNDHVPGFYIDVDQRHTEVLVLDVMNDPHVHRIDPVDVADNINFQDWDIGRNYARECFEPYMAAMNALLEKKIKTLVSPSEERDGYMGKLRVVKCDYGLINRSQAEKLADISMRSISATSTTVSLETSDSDRTCNSLPVQHIVTTKQHTPILLSHYFSGLKELNPLKGFVGFYNVLEYYFEEAPQLLGRAAAVELVQLKCVVELIVTLEEVDRFITAIPVETRSVAFTELPTSSGLSIRGMTASEDLRPEMARWLYEIRCAVIHSKKTRRGEPTPTFEPYSQASDVLHKVIPFVRWLAVQCIEKDYELRKKL